MLTFQGIALVSNDLDDDINIVINTMSDLVISLQYNENKSMVLNFAVGTKPAVAKIKLQIKIAKHDSEPRPLFVQKKVWIAPHTSKYIDVFSKLDAAFFAMQVKRCQQDTDVQHVAGVVFDIYAPNTTQVRFRNPEGHGRMLDIVKSWVRGNVLGNCRVMLGFWTNSL